MSEKPRDSGVAGAKEMDQGHLRCAFGGSGILVDDTGDDSKKSPTGPTERTEQKPEYPIALATYLGVHW